MPDGADGAERPPPPGSYSDGQLQAAVDALADAERFREAEDLVAAAAPGLQRVLAEALASGGWFEDGHQGEILKVASNPDSEQRLQALRVLIAEETRIAMMIGVAVGWSLSRELSPQPDIDKED